MTKNIHVRFSKKFVKQYNKVGRDIKEAFNRRLELFLQNPLNPILNNHPLIGRLTGFRSINITGDWRVLYSEYYDIKEIHIIFEALGTHSQLYK